MVEHSALNRVVSFRLDELGLGQCGVVCFEAADRSNVGLGDEAVPWTLEDAGDDAYYIITEEFGTLLNADRRGFNVNTR